MMDKLPPVPQSYTAWAAAERAFWQPIEIERRAGFWRDHLKGSRQIWSHRTDIVRNQGPLERHIAALNPKLTKAVRDLAARHGATLFSTLLAAFQVMLWRQTGQEDIVVGTPVANRNKNAVHQTMGYFAGVVPLRGQVDPAQSFSDHLRAMHATAVDCFSNALPFAELAQLVADPAQSTPHPIFDVRFALQNHPVPDVVLPRISTKLRMRSTGTARFDLGCELTEMGGELEVVWLYRSELFDQASIQALNAKYIEVVTQVSQHPEKPNRES
jgi:non-ribosomal peptide synthetase component F